MGWEEKHLKTLFVTEGQHALYYFDSRSTTRAILAWLASNNKKKIKYRPIIVMIVIQLVLGFLLLKTGIGEF